MQTAALALHTNNVFKYMYSSRTTKQSGCCGHKLDKYFLYLSCMCISVKLLCMQRFGCPILRLERRQLQCHRDAQMLQPQRKYSLFNFKQTTQYLYGYNVNRSTIETICAIVQLNCMPPCISLHGISFNLCTTYFESCRELCPTSVSFKLIQENVYVRTVLSHVKLNAILRIIVINNPYLRDFINSALILIYMFINQIIRSWSIFTSFFHPSYLKCTLIKN